jgi:hypothetical protein
MMLPKTGQRYNADSSDRITGLCGGRNHEEGASQSQRELPVLLGFLVVCGKRRCNQRDQSQNTEKAIHTVTPPIGEKAGLYGKRQEEG